MCPKTQTVLKDVYGISEGKVNISAVLRSDGVQRHPSVAIVRVGPPGMTVTDVMATANAAEAVVLRNVPEVVLYCSNVLDDATLEWLQTHPGHTYIAIRAKELGDNQTLCVMYSTDTRILPLNETHPTSTTEVIITGKHRGFEHCDTGKLMIKPSERSKIFTRHNRPHNDLIESVPVGHPKKEECALQ